MYVVYAFTYGLLTILSFARLDKMEEGIQFSRREQIQDGISILPPKIMKTMSDRGDLQLKVEYEPWWRPDIVHIQEVADFVRRH
jgi:hypothetical protein